MAELVHHGIKGQKWGVRRYQNKDGSLTAAGKRRMADQSEMDERKSAMNNRRTMSTKELQERISRLKLEQEFRKLTEEDISPGRKYAEDIVKSIGTKTLTAVGAGALVYAGKVALTKDFKVQEAANYIFANPNKKK